VYKILKREEEEEI